MGAFLIVLEAPLFDLEPCVGERNEDVLIKTFVAQARIGAFDVRVQ